MEEEREKDWVQMAKKGDKSAFEALILKYQRKIYFLCYKMTNDHYSADDLAQETFVRAYFNLRSFREEEPFYPWLRRIAVNLALNYIRDRKREVPLNNPSLKPSSSIEDIDEPDPDIIEEKIEKIVNSLPPELKGVFVLRYHEKMSYTEISKALKIPLGTVMSRLNRAREKIKSALKPYLIGGSDET